jgi:hypothetical protein
MHQVDEWLAPIPMPILIVANQGRIAWISSGDRASAPQGVSLPEALSLGRSD